MGIKERKLVINKILIFVISISLFALFVVATAPTTPTVITPSNNSIFFGDPVITVSSTDSESNPITYEFYGWNTSYVQTPSSDSWTNGQTACLAMANGWYPTTINNEAENTLLSSLFGGTNYIGYYYSGGKFIWANDSSGYTNWASGQPDENANIALTGSTGEWQDTTSNINMICENNNGNGTMQLQQNSSSATFNWSGIRHGHPNQFSVRAVDNNSEASNYTGNYTIYPMSFDQIDLDTRNYALTLNFINETGGNTISGEVSSISFNFNTDDVDGNNLQTYTGSSSKTSYNFSLRPSGVSIPITNGSITYGASGFASRTIQFNQTLEGGVLISQDLYLLELADGGAVSFQVVNSANSPLSGATVTATLNGNLIESKVTDSSGIATLYLNALSTYTITVSKVGYADSVQAVTPTQSSYSITLGEQSTTQPSISWGITYSYLPTSTILNNNTEYNFSFTIDSTYWNLTSYGFNVYGNNTLINSTSDSTTSGGALSQIVNTNGYSEIVFTYFWETTEGTYNSSITYLVKSTYQGTLSLNKFLTDLKNFDAFGFDDFGRVLVSIVLILLLVWGVYEVGIYNPLGIATLIMLFTFFLELKDIIPAVSIGGQEIKYFVSVLVFAVWLAFMVREYSR